jgi:hypothetical protein
MMQVRFSRLDRKEGPRGAMPNGVGLTDLAIGQLLGLAESAGIRLEVSNGRLLLASGKAGDRLLPTISTCFDQIGAEAVVEYFNRNPPERRAVLSATA